MAKTKHREDASYEIDKYISSLPAWSKKICEKLRTIALKSDTAIIEDWKWGPNYYCKGMVCGFAGFHKHVSFVFFQGALLKDKKKILQKNAGNLHNRHLKYHDVKEIDEIVLLEYLLEAIENNKKGHILLAAKDKTVVLPVKIKKEFILRGVLKNYEAMNYSRRKEIVAWLVDAKREETRIRRLENVVELLKKNMGLLDHYKK